VKKLFKLLSLLRLVKDLRAHRSYGGHGYGHRGYAHRSRSYYPLYQRGGMRASIAEGLLSRLLHGRRY
jgi:hypothetical protein